MLLFFFSKIRKIFRHLLTFCVGGLGSVNMAGRGKTRKKCDVLQGDIFHPQPGGDQKNAEHPGQYQSNKEERHKFRLQCFPPPGDIDLTD